MAYKFIPTCIFTVRDWRKASNLLYTLIRSSNQADVALDTNWRQEAEELPLLVKVTPKRSSRWPHSYTCFAL